MSVPQYPLYNTAHTGEVAGPGAWGPSVCGFNFQTLPDEYVSNQFKEMVDGGGVYGADITNVVKRYRITYTGLSAAQAAVLDGQWAAAKGVLLGFNFRLPASRGDTLLTDVHFESYEYPTHEQYAVQSRIITLVKRPA